jgi:hypothetical protein
MPQSAPAGPPGRGPAGRRPGGRHQGRSRR